MGTLVAPPVGARRDSLALVPARTGAWADRESPTAPGHMPLPLALSPPPLRRPRRGRASWPELAIVGVVAVAAAVALFHTAWAHPFGTQVGGVGDADEYSWFLSWVPYALGHGLDPLVSTYVSHPSGINLMWNTSVLLPSLLVSPLTVAFGAAFSYNVLVTAAPVLTTVLCQLAFRRWVGRLPSLAGALVVGFSPYMVAQSTGHLAQTLIMSAPLVLLALDRLLVLQQSRPWLDGLLLGLLAWAQLLTGEEVLAMEAVTAVIAVAVLCAVARREVGPHFPYAARGVGVAAGVCAALSAPFLAVQYLGPDKVENVHPANVYVSDLLNFVVPTNITKLAPAAALHISSHFTGNGSEDGAYLGILLVAFLLLALVVARRRRVTWVALAIAGAAAVLSMGPTLHVGGHVSRFPMPDELLQKLPALHNLLPDRFASMMTFGAGLLVALGCDGLKRLKRPAMASGWALCAAGLAALVPITNYPAAMSPFYWAFDTGLSCPPAGPQAAGSQAAGSETGPGHPV
ncbi:MAG: hypothetical protein ACRDZX_02330, partial [Acidimicrobiales bacterium]